MKYIAILLIIIGFYSTDLLAKNNKTKLTGDFTEGGMVIAKIDNPSSASLNSKELTIIDNKYVVFGFHYKENKNSTLIITHKDGTIEKISLDIKKRKYKIQRINGIAKKYISPAKETLNKIRTQIEIVKNTRKNNLLLTNFNEKFIMPVKGIVTGVFGSSRILNGKPRTPHYGIDIAANIGTLVKAPAGGVVTLSYPNMYYSGNTIILDHGGGISSSFLHLNKILVNQGDIVSKGDIIAKVGDTGRVTGAHLDWRVNWFSKRLDPQLLIAKTVN